MRIKSYFAGSVEQAIQQARQELGSEAMLVTSRRSSQQNRTLGAYEVVFALHPEEETSAQQEAEASGLSSELQVLRSQLDEIKRTLHLGHAAANSPETDQLIRDLAATDLSEDLARKIALEAYETPTARPGSTEALRARAREILHERIGISPDLDPSSAAASRILVLAGPAGAGKTTTLIKLAIQKYLASRTAVRIISVDPHRVASHEKLRMLAGIVGTSFTAANTIRELLETVDEYQSKNVLLIDTPGYGSYDMDSAYELSEGLRRLAKKETHLVLPASMKRADLIRAIKQYDQFRPDCLLFTKMDETESFGGLISAAVETGKPLSYFSRGQSIPEDLEPASSARLLETLFVKERAQATSAA